MNKTKVLKAGLTVMMITSLGIYGYQTYQTRKSENIYESAQQIAQIETTAEPTEAPTEVVTEAALPDTETTEVTYHIWREVAITGDPYMEELSGTNLAALRETNPDVAGWITIPDTKLSYPLMIGTEGDYYLDHTWEKNSSIAGSVFIEQLCRDDLTDFNTVIYGHRMKDDSMFGSLKYYKNRDYWEEHPYVYIFNDSGAHRYEIFSAYEANLQGSTYQIGFAGDEYKQVFLENCLGYSVFDTGVTPGVADRIITLSTCTGRGYSSRWVVQARLEGKYLQVPETEIMEQDIVLGVSEEPEVNGKKKASPKSEKP